jgi:hypothetical protein
MSMNLYRAVAIAEGFGEGIEASAELQATAWQWLIDTGHAFHLQGWYGRTALCLIRNGVCREPKPEGAALQLVTA